jgi:hypothetical protein
MFRPLALVVALVAPACIAFAAPPPGGPSALESEPAGWIDVTPGPDLAGWKRVPISEQKPLAATNPWTVGEGGVLRCAGVGVHESLLLEKPHADAILHVEWRFAKVEKKSGYNAGVYVRNSPDNSIWHQAQVGRFNVGYFFGATRVGEKIESFRAEDGVPQRGRDVGEWNVFEIAAKGRTITLWVNGAVTTTWESCEVPSGHFGLEAEGFDIEFRNLRVKPLP